MTAVCCAGRCLGCCTCCGSRRALARRAQARAVLPVLLVLLGAGHCTALAGAWPGWTLLGAALGGLLVDVLGRRPVIALSVPLQVVAILIHAWLVLSGDAPHDDAVVGVLEGPGNATASFDGGLGDGDEAVAHGVALGVRLVRSACACAALGLALPASLFYLAELWRGARRGAACCVPALAVLAGRTLAYGLEAATREAGAEAAARVAALAGLAPGCLGLGLLLLLAPPSPYWVALRGREVVLPGNIARLRGLRDERGARDEAEDVAETVREQRSSLCAGNWRGPLVSLLLVGGMPLVGVPRLEAHLPALLAPFGGEVADDGGRHAWRVRVAFGGGLLLAVAAVAAVVDRCGRRPLLAAACLALAAGHATLGYFHWFLGTPLPPRAALAWCITLGAEAVAAAAAAALAALAWLVLAEAVPMRAKAALPALALLLQAALQAALDAARVALPGLLLHAMDAAAEDGGLVPDAERAERRWQAAWCWAHSLWSLVLALLLALLLPETKGFSLAQLHEIFRGPNRQNMRTRL